SRASVVPVVLDSRFRGNDDSVVVFSRNRGRPERISAMTVEAHPVLHDIPIGIAAKGQRHEVDAMGGIDVPADRYWGAQTQRSLLYFAIGDDRMPRRLYHAYGYVKKAAALIHAAAGRLASWKAEAIARAADEAISGRLDEHFPLYVWQTGS